MRKTSAFNRGQRKRIQRAAHVERVRLQSKEEWAATMGGYFSRRHAPKVSS